MKLAAAASWATLSNNQQYFVHTHHPIDRRARTTVFVPPVVAHWLEREIYQWVRVARTTRPTMSGRCFAVAKTDEDCIGQSRHSIC